MVNTLFRRFSAALIILCFIAQPSFLIAHPASAEIEHRVESILNRMTLEEKIDMLGGVDGFFVRGFPRLGLPRLKMADGPVAGKIGFNEDESGAGKISEFRLIEDLALQFLARRAPV